MLLTHVTAIHLIFKKEIVIKSRIALKKKKKKKARANFVYFQSRHYSESCMVTCPTGPPRECLLLPRLPTVLVPAPQTGPGSPAAAPAEAPSMGSSSGSGAAPPTLAHPPRRPTRRGPLPMPGGARPRGS